MSFLWVLVSTPPSIGSTHVASVIWRLRNCRANRVVSSTVSLPYSVGRFPTGRKVFTRRSTGKGLFQWVTFRCNDTSKGDSVRDRCGAVPKEVHLSDYGFGVRGSSQTYLTGKRPGSHSRYLRGHLLVISRVTL